MTSEQPQPQRKRRWPWIAGGTAVALVAAGVAVVAVYGGGDDPAPAPVPSAPPQASQPAPAPSPSGGSFEGRGPNGCAGGEVIDANMVLTAQAEADESTDGAVEVAAAFTKWLVRNPLPSADEAAQVQAEVLAADAFTDDLPCYVAAAPQLMEPDRGDAYLTLANGVWQIESSTADTATVSIGSRIVENGAIDTQNAGSMTVQMVREDDAWKVVRGDNQVNVDVLFQNGIEFDGGC